MLEGSARKGAGRVRITAQLIEAETGTHLWADRFDGSLEDVFDLQDQVAISVAGVIEPALQAAETARLARRPTADLAAYDLYLRAYALMLSPARDVPEVLQSRKIPISSISSASLQLATPIWANSNKRAVSSSGCAQQVSQ